MLGYGAAMASADPLCGETWHKRKDGTSDLEGFVFHAIRDQDDTVLRFMGTLPMIMLGKKKGE
jgi:hypothetical protein